MMVTREYLKQLIRSQDRYTSPEGVLFPDPKGELVTLGGVLSLITGVVPERFEAVSSSRPIVVCLCGSTRFGDAFREANLRETLDGRIVLSIGCDMRSDADLFAHMTEDERTAVKRDLDELHKRKIDMADEVLILNVGGYIGESTRSELEYAQVLGKRVRYLEEPGQQRDQQYHQITQEEVLEELARRQAEQRLHRDPLSCKTYGRCDGPDNPEDEPVQ